MRRLPVMLVILGAVCAAPPASRAQLGQVGLGKSAPISRDQPVTFTADQVTYDREAGIVIASGHVEAWQNDHVLRADTITFDRNTNVAAARGNVVILEPDGQVLFADYAELTEGMKDGVLRDIRAIMAQNGKLAANGARRTGGEINEFSRIVYTTCNVCASDPDKPPLWQLRAYSAVQDVQNKRIEYYDATMEMLGVPVGYLPYFSHADPSVKRASGILIPTVGVSSRLGTFFGVPYYGVLDDQSDVTVTPLVTTKEGENLAVEYRRRFNDGVLTVNGSIASISGEAQGAVYADGKFAYDDTWRYGFTIDRATSVDYIRDFELGRYLGGISDVLTSQIYVEGFGEGAYARLDSRFYQSLTTAIVDSKLPIVLPRYEYSYVGETDDLGGRLRVDTQDFNVLRDVGTSTQRASLSATYEVPFTGALGDLWTARAHFDAAAYDATALDQQPNYSDLSHLTTTRALPQASLGARWPFMRDSGDWGTQVVEPIVEVVVAPVVGDRQFVRIPNEDSLDLEFTDSNLFGFNRFPGIDRLEGGVRLNAALHGTWYLNGTVLDGQFGQSFRAERDKGLPFGSGLSGPVSDYVGHLSFAPAKWLDVTYRTRLDHDDFRTRLADVVGTIGEDPLTFNLGYLYSTYNPFSLYDRTTTMVTVYDRNTVAATYDFSPLPAAYFIPRNEITAGFNAKYDQYRLSAYARRDLQTNKMVALGAEGAWENECYIFDVKFFRRYTSIDNDNGSTSVLFTMTFKTVGQFGFHAF